MKKNYQQPKAVVHNVHLRNHLMSGSDTEYIGTGEPGALDVKAESWGTEFVKNW